MTEETKEILQKLEELQAKHDNTTTAWLKIEQAKLFTKTAAAIADCMKNKDIDAALAVMDNARITGFLINAKRANKFPSGGSHIDSKGESKFEIGETIINRIKRKNAK